MVQRYLMINKRKSYRKSTIHHSESKNKGLSRFKRNYRESNTSIKTKNMNLYIVGRTDADGNVTTVTRSILYVNVTLKAYRDMISCLILIAWNDNIFEHAVLKYRKTCGRLNSEHIEKRGWIIWN